MLLARLLLMIARMTNTSFIAQRRNGVDMIALKIELTEKAERFSWIDGSLLATFIASFLGLICLLAQ